MKRVEGGRLSQSGCQIWCGRLKNIERISVLALVQRFAADSGEEYRAFCKSEQWEIPVAEVVYWDGKRR